MAIKQQFKTYLCATHDDTTFINKRYNQKAIGNFCWAHQGFGQA